MSDKPYNGISDGEDDVESDNLAIDSDEPEINGGDIQKNLFDEFKELEAENTSSNGREYMKAYLRIRPFTEDEKDKDENQDCMEMEGDNAILLNAPKDSFTFKNEKRGREVTHRFTFSKVFGPITSQKGFFDETSLGLVKDFMDGQNCLVFTYGVTNSGKTYTIQGTPKDGGVLPRTLDVLFNSIEGKEYTRMNLKPRYFCDVLRLDEKQEHMEAALRNGLIMSLNKEHFDLNSFLHLEDSELSKISMIDESALQASVKSHDGNETADQVMDTDDNESRIADDTTISVDTQGDVRFSVWVSFAEIYNELIFDLLEPCPEGKGKKRTTLKLGDDKSGNPYIKGLREVCVSNAEEAYKILRVGKKNQRIASTKLNHASSRSHCIFSIKILRVMNVDNPHVARVSRLSFVDLAGSERYSKTQSTGDRLKEAGNINTSLMTLGKCLDYLRFNQQHPTHPQMIPFRESKLTRLFQGIFCGKGKATMVVNINQCASTFDETYHALKFSAIAKQVSTRVVKPCDVLQPLPEKSFRASFAFNALSRSVRKSVAWENGSLTTPAGGKCSQGEDEDEEEDAALSSYQQQLEQLVKVLQEQLITEKSEKATMEMKIREEVCAEMAEQLVSIENAYREGVQEQVHAVEEKCDRRIELLARSVKKNRKRPRMDRMVEDDEEWVPSVLLHAEQVKTKNLTTKLKEADLKLEDLTKAAADAKQRLVEAEGNIKRLNKEANHAKQMLLEDEKRCIAQDEALSALRSCLETSSKELEIARIKLDQRDRKLREKEKDMEALKRQLREKEEIVSQQSEALEKGSQELQGKSCALEKMEQELKQTQSSLEEKVNTVMKEQDLVTKLQRDLTEKEAAVDRKIEIIENGKQLVESLKSDLARKTEALEKEEVVVKKMEAHLREKDAALEEKNTIIQNEQERVKKLETNIHEHQVALNANDSFVGQLNEQVKQLSHELEEAKNSKPVEQVTPVEEERLQGREETKDLETQHTCPAEPVEQVKPVVEEQHHDVVTQFTCTAEPVEQVKPGEEQQYQGREESKDVETQLACTVGQLREELIAKDELMKELVRSLEETRAEVEFEKGELVLQCEEYKKQISELQKEVAAMRNKESDSVNDDVETLKKSIQSLETQLERANTEKEAIKEQSETDDFEKEEVKSALESANLRITELEKQLESHFQELTSQTGKETEIEELKKSLETANSELEEVQKQVDLKNAELEEQKVKSAEREDLKISMASISAKLVESEQQIEANNTELVQLSAAISESQELKSALEIANKKVKELQGQILSVELGQQAMNSEETSELLELRAAVAKANKTVSNFEDVVALKEGRLQELLAEVDEMRKDLETQKQAIEDSRSDEVTLVNELETKLKAAEEKLFSLEESVAEKVTALEKAESALKEAEKLQELAKKEGGDFVKELETKLKAADGAISSLEESVVEKVAALEKAESAIKEAEKLQELAKKEGVEFVQELQTKLKAAEGTISTLEESVAEKVAALKEAEKLRDQVKEEDANLVNELQTKLNATEEKLSSMEESLSEKQTALDKAQSAWREANEKLEEYAKEDKKLNDGVIEKDSKISAENHEIADLLKSLAEKETALKEAEEKLLSRSKPQDKGKQVLIKESVEKTRKGSLGERSRKRFRKEDESVEKDAAVSAKELEKQLESSTRALDKKNTQLIARNNTIKRLELNIIEKNNKIDELEKEKLKASSISTPSKDPRTREEIRTLRRRVREADNEVEDVKRKLQNSEEKLKKVRTEVEEYREEKETLGKNSVAFEQRISELQTERDDTRKEFEEAKERAVVLEKKIEEFHLEGAESTKGLEEKDNVIAELKKELQHLKDHQQQEQLHECEKAKEEATRHEKLLEEAKQKMESAEKEMEKQLAAVGTELDEALRRAEAAEAAAVSKTVENVKNEEGKYDEIKQLKELVEKKMEEIMTKEKEIKDVRERASKSDQEKSDELDKVWKTMLELQGVIKERGETIDHLESKLTAEESKHTRQRNTLEQTVAKMKEVMESKGCDKNKLNLRVVELEGQLKEKMANSDVLLKASEKREKEFETLKQALKDQDQVMEEQQDALNERQAEIESLTNENQSLKQQVDNYEALTAEVRRLEGTLSVYVEEKAKLEKELAGMRKSEEGLEISKVEISRDFEKEKSDILVKLQQKEGVIAKLKTQHKGAESSAAKEKRMLQQKLKEKEWEVKKLNENLEKVEIKKAEYEELIQLKENDIRKATEEKDGMLKAMREAFEVASSKKAEFESKLDTLREQCEEELRDKHEKEIAQIRNEYEAKLAGIGGESGPVGDMVRPKIDTNLAHAPCEQDMKAEHKREIARIRHEYETQLGRVNGEFEQERTVLRKIQSDAGLPRMVVEDHKPSVETKSSKEDHTTSSETETDVKKKNSAEHKKAVNRAENEPFTKPAQKLAKRRTTRKYEVQAGETDRSVDTKTSESEDSVKDVDEPETPTRIEIDVTPVMAGRRRTRANTATKTSTRKRQSSGDVPLAELKAQLSAKKSRRPEASDDEFTPGSVRKGRAKSATKRPSSVVKAGRPSMRQTKPPLSPMNEILPAKNEPLSAKKKKGFFGKLFETAGGENSPPGVAPSTGKKKRKLLKKDISGPVGGFSPATGLSSKESIKSKDPASRIITRQLRSRTVK